MTAECQNCRNRYFVSGFGTESVACPDCGGDLAPERDQPGGTDTDFAVRMHGDPGQDGIWAGIDGGWKGLDRRDERAGSVKTAAYDVPNVQPGPDGIHAMPLGLLRRLMSIRINGEHVDPHDESAMGNLFNKYGRRDSPHFGQPVTVTAHAPEFAQLAARIISDGHGMPAPYAGDVQALQQGIAEGRIPKPVDETGRPILAHLDHREWVGHHETFNQEIYLPWNRTADFWDGVKHVLLGPDKVDMNPGPGVNNVPVNDFPVVPIPGAAGAAALGGGAETAAGGAAAGGAAAGAGKLLKTITRGAMGNGGGVAKTLLGLGGKAAILNALTNSGEGNSDLPQAPVDAPSLQQVTHVHSFDTTPTSLDKIPEADNTGDTQEFKDQSDSLNPDNPGNDESLGANLTPETQGMVNQLLPKLLDYYESERSAVEDPELKELISRLEKEIPGFWDDDDGEGSKENEQNDDPILVGSKVSEYEAILPGPSLGLGLHQPSRLARCPACGYYGPMAGVCPHCGYDENPNTLYDESENPNAVYPRTATPIQPGNAIVPPMGQRPVGPNPQASRCPVCGSTLDLATHTCPQCGYNPADPQSMNRALTPGVTAKTADTQGPRNPDQQKAVAQLLIDQGRANEIPTMLDPATSWQYAEELAQVQNDPNPPPPSVEQPTQPQPDPSQMMMQGQPPGGMPPGAMPTGPGAGGMPMQGKTADSFDMRGDQYPLPSGGHGQFYRCPNCGGQMNTDTGECYGCGYTYPYDGGEVLDGHDNPTDWAVDMRLPLTQGLGPRHQGASSIASAVARFAADNIAPRCPNCGSHTTGIVSDKGHCGCHACKHMWESGIEHGRLRTAAPEALEDLSQEPEAVDHIDDHQEPEVKRTWETTTGEPLEVGHEYELHSSKYPIPDIVKVVDKNPSQIIVSTEGAIPGLDDEITITKQEALDEDYTFVPSAGQDPEAGNQTGDEYLNDAEHSPRQNTDPTPTSAVPFTSSKRGHPRARLAYDPASIDQTAYQSIVDNGGVTMALDGTIPDSGYAFSPFKNWEMRIPQDQFLPENVTQYITQHRQALEQPNSFLGAWISDGEVYLDVSQVLPDLNQALQAAAQADQSSVYDLSTFQEIPVPQENSAPGPTENDDVPVQATARVEGLDWLREGTQIGGASAPWEKPLPDLTGGDIFDPTAEQDAQTGPDWLMEGTPSAARVAGKRFTPSEQKKFIDEEGVARNIDRLDLEGTHYRTKETNVNVRGRGEMRFADPDRVPSDHLLFGLAG